jgi:hypothetical protein
MKAALEPVKLFECIGKAGCDVGSGFAVQPLGLDCRAPAAAFRRERLRFRTVWAWLAGALPAGSVTSCNREPSESDVGGPPSLGLRRSKEITEMPTMRTWLS